MNVPGPLANHGITWRETVSPEDPARVEAIVRATGFFHETEVAIAVELVTERLERGAESGYEFLFAETSQPAGRPDLLGYSCYGPIPGTEGSFDLYWIAVAPEWQGHGIGRHLLAETDDRIGALGGRCVYAETSGKAQYEPTRRFYLQTGFREAARLPDFYSRGDDKLIYERSVTRGNGHSPTQG